MMDLRSFAEVWVLDFEFQAEPGERPQPVCMVAREAKSRRILRIWKDELETMRTPPISIGAESLCVAYYASAEIGCFLSLGWTLPTNILDLYVEFRNLVNGKQTPSGRSLLGALIYFGLDAMPANQKDAMRELIMAGGPWSPGDQQAILDYCTADVDALASLMKAMEGKIDLPRALLRGKYMAAVAIMEHHGIPIDLAVHSRLQRYWASIQEHLIQEVDAQFGAYDGNTFKADRWATWASRRGIAWPTLTSGALALDEQTFKDMAKAFPEVDPMRQLRSTLGELRRQSLAIGRDGRNRCLLSPFGSKTGRNQPSNSRFIFGQSAWLRGLIRPEAGNALAYIDWSQQEFGIAAALSKDPAMIAAYKTGDPYLRFAIQAGAAPPDATKASHKSIRDQFKACALGVQYAMGQNTLATRIGKSPAHARELLELHRRVYPVFWNWIESALDHAAVYEHLDTVFGWRLYTTVETKVPALLNYPMQANGAEMMRLACCFAIECGVRVCAPVHDAILIEAPIGEIDEAVEVTQTAMARASRAILGCLELSSDAKIIRFPDRYMDERGQAMWDAVMSLLSRAESLDVFKGEQGDVHV